MLTVPTDDPRAVAAVEAIHAGDSAALARLLKELPAWPRPPSAERGRAAARA